MTHLTRFRVAAGAALVLGLFGLAAARPAAADVLNVAGRYEGMVRGSSQGDMTLTVTLAQEGNKLTGGMDAGNGAYVLTIISGTVEGSKVSWDFSNGEVSGGVTGTYADGTIKGSWSAGGEGGTFELKKAAK